MIVKSLSVFFPAYNEGENIKKTVLDVKKVLDGLNLKDYEIIVVNDGSKDNTAEVVTNLTKQDKRIRLVGHSSNKGYGDALKTGFSSSKYSWVAFMDSDGQFDFSEITKFLEKADQADLILGYRLTRADTILRKVFTWGWKTLAEIFLGLQVRDYSCGFKMIKREVFDSIQPLHAKEKVTQIEMLVKAQRKGFKFAEVGVHHYPRKFGLATGANFYVVLRSFRDFMKFWLELNFNKQKA
ncbi:glycosyltransferase family 2 protein [Candidatus Daviesbacteria bacterium]|nr:glycosyltransferase family 2 protein [Candidatus Daviesbacteria bacterium]